MSQSSESSDSISESQHSETGRSLSLISNSSDSDYIPSQTPETEDYTSQESSELMTPSESEYSTDSGSYDYDYSSLDNFLI